MTYKNGTDKKPLYCSDICEALEAAVERERPVIAAIYNHENDHMIVIKAFPSRTYSVLQP